MTKGKFKRFFSLCPVAHRIILIFGSLIGVYYALRGNHDLMVTLSCNVVRPCHKALSGFCALFPFSVAEMLIILAIIFVVAAVVLLVRGLIKSNKRTKTLYMFFARILALFLVIYSGFCLLWGVFFFGDSFAVRSGLKEDKISVEQLKKVTAYFAALANEYSGKVTRNKDGYYICDKEEILNKSTEVYRPVEKLFPALKSSERKVKSLYFSRALSYFDFTGFFFPFTAEANVSVDFPAGDFAATVAHEISHQRGVAKEQEANFVAVVACLEYGDVDFVYSASLLAYTHLGNALYSASHEDWEEIYNSLDHAVLKDFALNRAYWDQFKTPVRSVSNTVYEGLLQSFKQELGLKSYGACVDLLVNYYEPLI